MTEKDIDDRVNAILRLQDAFTGRVKDAQANMYTYVLESWDALRKNTLPTFKTVWSKFYVADYEPLIESFAADMREVVKLNEAYFDAKVPTEQLFEQLGISETGVIAKEGYVSTILQDQTVKREVQIAISRTKQLKFDQKVKEDIKALIKGTPKTETAAARPGVVEKFTEQSVTPTYNEADRIVQNDMAIVSYMDAGMYTGGLIDGSRPFCVERNRKIFLRSEIAKFGTIEDKWGGYTDKANGLFSGKPKTGYDPFTMLGGYKCRHHLSWLADEFAIRKDPTLEIVDGKLKRKEK